MHSPLGPGPDTGSAVSPRSSEPQTEQPWSLFSPSVYPLSPRLAEILLALVTPLLRSPLAGTTGGARQSEREDWGGAGGGGGGDWALRTARGLRR